MEETLFSASVPPNDMAELKRLIVSRALPMPHQIQQVARIALERPDLVAFGTVKSLAAASSVSPTSVMRLLRILGFYSFRDFKMLFQAHVKALLRTKNRQLPSAPIVARPIE